MGRRTHSSALIALCLVAVACGVAAREGASGSHLPSTAVDLGPALVESRSLATPPTAATAKPASKSPAAVPATPPSPKPEGKGSAHPHARRTGHTPLSPARDPTRVPGANGQAAGSEVMDEDFVKRESNPESFKPWNGKVKIPSAADEAFEKELALMTKGDSVGKQQEEQNSVQLRQQRVANDNIKYLRSISTIAQKRIARLSELAKEMEAARVQAFDKNKEVVQNAAQYSTEDQRQRLERLKKEGDEKLQREKDALTRKAEISALDEEENRDELEAKMNNLLPVDYKFTPQSEKVLNGGGTDIAAVPAKTVTPHAIQAKKDAQAKAKMAAVGSTSTPLAATGQGAPPSNTTASSAATPTTTGSAQPKAPAASNTGPSATTTATVNTPTKPPSPTPAPSPAVNK